jgi:hypothetical protein
MLDRDEEVVGSLFLEGDSSIPRGKHHNDIYSDADSLNLCDTLIRSRHTR